MIDNPKYSDTELMQQIREKYGTERTTIEGIAEASGTVQDGLRSSEPESREPGNTSIRREQTNGRNARKVRRDAGVTRGSYKRKGRTGPAPHQGNGGYNGSSRSADREIFSDQREPGVKEDYADKEDKPSGLDTKPNAKERKIRQEQEQAEAAAKSTAASQEKPQNFFAWLRPDDRRKGRGEKSTIRNKPLSTKEADEIRGPLISALGDYFRYTDELLSGTSANGVQAQIWTSIDDEDIAILVDAWLSRAQKDPKAARYAVHAVNRHYELKIAMILAPRFYQTFKFYVNNGMRSPFPQGRRKQREKQRRPLAVVARDN